MAAFLLWVCVGGALGQARDFRKLQQTIDEVVRDEMNSRGLVGVAIGIADNGVRQYTQGYGLENVELSIPVEANRTKFRWASIAKTLTAVIGLRLRERGMLDFDAPIQTYYPTPGWPATLYSNGQIQPLPNGSRTITFRQLMAHQGGIPHYDNGLPPGPEPPVSDLRDPVVNQGIQWAVQRYLIGQPLIRIPGQFQTSYSTFGMNLAGVIEEIVTGQSWGELLDREIVRPASIDFLELDDEFAPTADRAVGYFLNDESVPVDEGSVDVSYKAPGGGVLSRVTDLLDYGVAMSRNVFLTPQSLELLKTQQPGGIYGIGFQIGHAHGTRFIGHSGSQEKAKTYFRVYDDGLVIAVMSNSRECDPQALLERIDSVYRAAVGKLIMSRL